MTSTYITVITHRGKGNVQMKTILSRMKIPWTQIYIRQTIRKNGEILSPTWGSVTELRKEEHASHFKNRYGITEKEAEKIMADRKNADCGICGERKKILHLDHNHENGQIRGLVCRRCNMLLGRIENPIKNHFLFQKLMEWISKGGNYGFGEGQGG